MTKSEERAIEGSGASPTGTARSSAGTRLSALDVVRGIAIIGTLASNIWLFVSFDGERVIDIWWQGFLRWFPDGKSLGLLTIMFGVGLEIQRRSALRSGRRWPGTYPVRAGLLFLDGLLNYVFVVQFDVLRAYALLGIVVAFVLLLPDRRQWIVIGAALTVHLGLLTAAVVNPAVFERVPTLMLFGDPPVREQRPTYWQTVSDNLHTMLVDLSLGGDVGTILIMGIAVFTLGAMVYRNGIFDDRGRRLRKWLMLVGFGVGLPVDFALFLVGADATFGRYAAAILVSFGVLALVAEFYTRHRVGFVGRRLATVGRMALSCYVLQNVIGRTAQQQIGGSALSGMVDPVIGTLLMFVVIAVILVVFSEIWLRFFPRGPLELVWDWSFRWIMGRRPRAVRP